MKGPQEEDLANEREAAPVPAGGQFIGMPLGLVDGMDMNAQAELDTFWPGWRKFADGNGGLLPPLDDGAVEAAVRTRGLPEWIIDGVKTVERFGGEAWGHEDYQPHLFESKTGWVVKPRWNPEGLARAARVWKTSTIDRSLGTAPRCIRGEMVQRRYLGLHVSLDVAMLTGRVRWGIEAVGHPSPGRFGRFSHWTVRSGNGRTAFNSETGWPDGFSTGHLEEALPHYSGVVNLEYIGGQLIEAHFRPSLELFPLYGALAAQCLMEVACWKVSPNAPPVSGGLMQVVARGTRRVNVRREFGEHSWRRQLVYTID